MKKLFVSLLTLFSFLFLFCFINSKSVEASTEVYKITDAFNVEKPPTIGNNYVHFYTFISFNYRGGTVMLSQNPDGTGGMDIGDILQVAALDNSFNIYYPPYLFCSPHPQLQPTDITSNFTTHKTYTLMIRLLDACGGSKSFSQMYVVIKNIPDVSPTPTPTLTPILIPTATPMPTATPTPTPVAPFLDLPWNYEAKGQSFNDAALSMTSFFDHTYPLLSTKSLFDEPSEFQNQVTNFANERSSDMNYSSHDGYDFASLANVHIGDAVLAAAAGTASYINSCPDCGNMIVIDHHNGYQTRYLHLQKDGLITDVPGSSVEVSGRQPIGKVGATGHVIPDDERGAHIHFGVIEDKNHDHIFNDIPDGYTDPFGWQSSIVDPWSVYTFNYAGITKSGDKSKYLWKFDLNNNNNVVSALGGTIQNGHFTLNFPEGAVSFDTNINLKSGPIVNLPTKRSVGPKLVASATDSLGNVVSQFQKTFSIVMDFSTYDLTPFKLKTISLYSSHDGYTWEKQNTVIDMKNKTATAQLNHFSEFALMGDLKDVKPPETVVKIKGKKNPDKSYRPDVKLELKAKDDHKKLGVSYSMYKLDDGDWNQYVTPLVVTNEGHHVLEFYSVDSLDNIEPTKKIEFDIHKKVQKNKFEKDDEEEHEEIVSGIKIRTLITKTKGE